MKDVIKKCILCGNEFIGTNDNEPNHQLCPKCSYQLTRHINPEVSKTQHLSEIIFFALSNVLIFALYIKLLKNLTKNLTIKEMFKCNNGFVWFSVIMSIGILILIFTIINSNKKKRNVKFCEERDV